MESILSIVVDSDIAAELIELCKGSGRSLIALMYKRALTAKPPDKALVIKTYDSYMIHGLLGEVNLASFNSFYKEHTKLLRTMPPAERAARGSDATIMQMLNNTKMSSIEHRKQFQLILIAEPPSTKEDTVKLIREMLRTEAVYEQLDNVGSNTNVALTAQQQSSLAAANLDPKKLHGATAASVASALVAAGKRKHDGGGGPKDPNKNKKFVIPRDASGRITHWVVGMDECGCGASGCPGKILRRDCPTYAKQQKSLVVETSPDMTVDVSEAQVPVDDTPVVSKTMTSSLTSPDVLGGEIDAQLAAYFGVAASTATAFTC